MANNKGIKIQVKNDLNNYSTVYPKTTKEQVIGWNIGEVFGPYVITLKASDWKGYSQEIELNGVSEKDIVYCSNVVAGNKEQIKKQNEAYALLNPYVGIISFENKLRFLCGKKIPKTDINVQVWWTK